MGVHRGPGMPEQDMPNPANASRRVSVNAVWFRVPAPWGRRRSGVGAKPCIVG